MKKKLIKFLLLMGFVFFITALVIVKVFCDSSPRMTQVKLYQAWDLNSEQINNKLKVVENLEASCWTSSNVDARPDAWRCMASNRILDPCFSANPAAQTVVCSQSPWTKNVSLVHLTKTLPLPSANSDVFLAKNPWVLVLADNQKCYPIGGATFGFAGMRNNYSCAKKGSLLFGPLSCEQSFCKVFYYQPGQAGLKQVLVKEVWY